MTAYGWPGTNLHASNWWLVFGAALIVAAIVVARFAR